jgi:small subunit ribosomal protein S7
MRTKRAKIRVVNPDPVYGSVKIEKLINRVMERGKKSIARKQVYGALSLIKTKTNQDPLEVFDAAIQNITPKMEVRSRRVGGAAYQVPTPVPPRRAFSLALRWLVAESNKRPNKEFRSYAEKLAAEIIDATNSEGGSIQKKLTSHKMAEANKAFAHFRW